MKTLLSVGMPFPWKSEKNEDHSMKLLEWLFHRKIIKGQVKSGNVGLNSMQSHFNSLWGGVLLSTSFAPSLTNLLFSVVKRISIGKSSPFQAVHSLLT